MPERTCVIDGCDRPAKSRGWCQTHYMRWRRNGDPLIVTSKPPLPTGCSIDGCAGSRYARGWCAVHYGRWFNHGSPDERTETVACVDCDVSFVRTRQGGALRCDPCRLAAERGYGRTAWEKKAAVLRAARAQARAANSRACKICGTIFAPSMSSGPLPSTCSQSCRKLDKDLRGAAWRKANPDKVRDYQHNRRAILRDVPHARIDEAVVAERDNFTCALCHEPVDCELRWPHPMSPSLDHIIPLSKDGTSHTYANVQLSHYSCNCRRGARPLEAAN